MADKKWSEIKQKAERKFGRSLGSDEERERQKAEIARSHAEMAQGFLGIDCGSCGKPVTLHFAEPIPTGQTWGEVQSLYHETWTCPWCQQPDDGAFASRVASVTQGRQPPR